MPGVNLAPSNVGVVLALLIGGLSWCYLEYAPNGHGQHAPFGKRYIRSLGTVFGDLGTVGIYALKSMFFSAAFELARSSQNVWGGISFIFWISLLFVAWMYMGSMMRIDNDGHGGIMALIARLYQNKDTPRNVALMASMVAIVGTSTLLSDGALTGTVSLLSATNSAYMTVNAGKLDLPGEIICVIVSLMILAGVWYMQRFGTNKVSNLMAPFMISYFVTQAFYGGWIVSQVPGVILEVINPLSAISFIVANWAKSGAIAFILGTSFLAITGCEACYADMGHFQPLPIKLAWATVVFPALMLSFMGQGVMILQNPEMTDPFMAIVPHGLDTAFMFFQTPLATTIATQALFTGIFSLIYQGIDRKFCIPMGYHLPDGADEGQVFSHWVNNILAALTALAIIIYHNGDASAEGYGLMVNMTMMATCLVYYVVCRYSLKLSIWKAGLKAGKFIVPVGIFLFFNLGKLGGGALFPTVVAIIVALAMARYFWRNREDAYVYAYARNDDHVE